MYIRQATIHNIRSIDQFTLTFPEGKEAGWHVLIGDNGAGKSTIVKSIALALLRPADINATREDWQNWLRQGADEGSIAVDIAQDTNFDLGLSQSIIPIKNIISFLRLLKLKLGESDSLDFPSSIQKVVEIREISSFGTLDSGFSSPPPGADPRKGWFSAAYGPFRRFTGGNPEKERLFKSNPRLGAHLSVFGEDVALSETLNYIRELYIKDLEGRDQAGTLSYIIRFINEANLLPHDTVIERVNSDGVFFKDGNGKSISAVDMSDGFRSVLNLTFELIQQLLTIYGPKQVFRRIAGGDMVIDLPGVVLIDEVDAHLHPTWQTRIGQWFLKYFPAIQFIVTTHSPLICRASEKGSIWRLAAPGSYQAAGEITGSDRDRLIYGNVLDAYGTEVFGENVSQSADGQDLSSRVAELNKKSFMGTITAAEKDELIQLKAKLPTAR